MTTPQDAADTFRKLAKKNRGKADEYGDWDEPKSQSQACQSAANAYEDAARYLEEEVVK